MARGPEVAIVWRTISMWRWLATCHLPLALSCLITHCWADAAEPDSHSLKDSPSLKDGHSLKDGGRVICTYQAQHVPSPDPAAPWYGRSGFIHPVYTPQGRIVTEGFPRDHMHQHGLMFAWTSSYLDGQPVDFWNSAKQQGRVRHAQSVRADDHIIEVLLEHLADRDDQPKAVLMETWTIARVAHESMHVFDLVSSQECTAAEPLTIREYHYGAMCIRGPTKWLEPAAKMLTSEGKDRLQGNHSRPRWVAMFSSLDNQPYGIAAMAHPSNFRSPQPVRLHPSKPYFCFAPMVLGDFSIDPGQPYVSRFRFVAFDGEPQHDQLDEIWRQFATH